MFVRITTNTYMKIDLVVFETYKLSKKGFEDWSKGKDVGYKNYFLFRPKNMGVLVIFQFVTAFMDYYSFSLFCPCLLTVTS